MGNNVDDIPWPARRPRRPKQPKKGSGSGTGTTVGMAVLAFMAFPAGVVLGVALFLAHGYGVI